jgi:hypothetical protein
METELAAAEKQLVESDHLADAMAGTTDVAELLRLGKNRIDCTLESARLFSQNGEYGKAAISYLSCAGVTMLLASRGVLSFEHLAHFESIMKNIDMAYTAFQKAGHLRVTIHGLMIIKQYLGLVYALCTSTAEKEKVEDALVKYAKAIVYNLGLLHRLEQDGLKIMEESAKLHMAAAALDNKAASADLLEASAKLYDLSFDSLLITGNYRLLGDAMDLAVDTTGTDSAAAAGDNAPIKYDTTKAVVTTAMDNQIKNGTSTSATVSACPGCRAEYAADDLFCSNCGFDLKMTTMLCPLCEKPVKPDDVFCANCGSKLKPDMHGN